MLFGFNSMATANEKIGDKPLTTEVAVDHQKLIDRLEEINSLDKSKLSRAEKKELRKEVKEIQKTMDIGGGVYISVGALILIIILLIILL